MPESVPPISTLADVHARFAALADDDGLVRHFRGTALAVAEDWLKRIPAGPRRDLALYRLSEAAELACEAYELTK